MKLPREQERDMKRDRRDGGIVEIHSIYNIEFMKFLENDKKIK